MPINGEAIFDTRPWTVFGEGPSTLPKPGYMNELKQPLTAEDIRFTTKADAVYAIVLGLPAKEFAIAAFRPAAGRVAAVTLLGSNVPLTWVQGDRGLVITPPAAWPSRHAVAFKIRLAP